jgi:hypothetical protein
LKNSRNSLALIFPVPSLSMRTNASLCTRTHTYTHVHTHTHTHTSTHTYTHSQSMLLECAWTYSTHSLTHSPTHSLPHSLPHSFTTPLPHSLTPSLTHSPQHSRVLVAQPQQLQSPPRVPRTHLRREGRTSLTPTTTHNTQQWVSVCVCVCVCVCEWVSEWVSGRAELVIMFNKQQTDELHVETDAE